MSLTAQAFCWFFLFLLLLNPLWAADDGHKNVSWYEEDRRTPPEKDGSTFLRHKQQFGRSDKDDDGFHNTTSLHSNQREEEDVRALILNGLEPKSGKYPYYVRLDRKVSIFDWLPFCGGIVLGKDLVLTAAHCYNSVQPGERVRAVVGAETAYFAFTGTDIEAKPLEPDMRHAQYNTPENSNDLMIVPLMEKIPKQYRNKYKMNKKSTRPSPGSKVKAMGTGRTDPDDSDPSDLHHVKLIVQDDATCNTILQNLAMKYDEAVPVYYPEEICTGPSNENRNRGVCQGDSGGPLIMTRNNKKKKKKKKKKDILIGIASRVVASCRAGYPDNDGVSIFVEISAYTDWIDEMICKWSAFKPDTCCGVQRYDPNDPTQACCGDATVHDPATTICCDADTDAPYTTTTCCLQEPALDFCGGNPGNCVTGCCSGKCSASCGDGVCEGSETLQNCREDCFAGPPVCLDLFCDDWLGETTDNCRRDCFLGPAVCGDGFCDEWLGETVESCRQDCHQGPYECGDGFCDDWLGETAENCRDDCSAGPAECGDGYCDAGENDTSCPEDCPHSQGFCPAVDGVRYGTTYGDDPYGSNCGLDGEPRGPLLCGVGTTCQMYDRHVYDSWHSRLYCCTIRYNNPPYDTQAAAAAAQSACQADACCESSDIFYSSKYDVYYSACTCIFGCDPSACRLCNGNCGFTPCPV